MLNTLRLYGRTFNEALRRAARSWPVVLALPAYAVILIVASILVAPLGLMGGFVLGFVFAACGSSYLHFVEQAVRGSRLAWSDIKRGFGARFWDVVSVMFAFWIISFLLAMLQRSAGRNGVFIAAAAGLLMAVFFNPVPELLYQGSSRSFGLLADSARFMTKHGLEWLVPNFVLALLLLAPGGNLTAQPGALILSVLTPGGFIAAILRAPIWAYPALLLIVHVMMVFRGLLFQELTSGSARTRAWQDMWRR